MRRLPLNLLLLLLLALPSTAAAKDLRGKIGVGFNNNFGSLTSLSVKAGLPTKEATFNLQIEATVGFALLADDDDRFFAGARVLLPLLAEDNLNLYGVVGAGYARLSDQRAGLRVNAAFGVEFFLFGLENLGLSAEVGLTLDAGNQKFDLQTTSGSFSQVGVHYYFGGGRRRR